MVREEDYENLLRCDLFMPQELLLQDKVVFPVKHNDRVDSKRLQVFEWLVAGNSTSIATPKRPQPHTWIKFEPKAMESTFK